MWLEGSEDIVVALCCVLLCASLTYLLTYVAPGYLPPEVLCGATAFPTQLADAWALGCVLYFCLYGRAKYYGSTFAEVFAMISHDKSCTPSKRARNDISKDQCEGSVSEICESAFALLNELLQQGKKDNLKLALAVLLRSTM